MPCRRGEDQTAKQRSVGRPWCQTLTYEQCQEMERHGKQAANTGVLGHFQAQAVWLLQEHQRAGPPQGTGLSTHGHEQLVAITHLLNRYSRTLHGFYPPYSVYQAMLDKLDQPDSAIRQSVQHLILESARKAWGVSDDD